MEITREKLEGAMQYLAETDEEWARLKSNVEAKDYARKSIRAEIKLEKKGSNNLRLDIAEASSEYQNACKDKTDAMYDFLVVDARRKRAQLTIEVWRSLNAARNKGNIS